MTPELSDDTVLDEGVALLTTAAETPAGRSLADWLAQHGDRAAELARFASAERELETWTAPLRTAAWSDPDRTTPQTQAFALAPRSDRLGEYELLEELGRGGMGVVYKARQPGLARLVALKMLPAGELALPQESQRLRFEAEAAAGLAHPHIVKVYEVGEGPAGPYFSMELIEGGSLADRLRGLGPDEQVPAREAARLVMQVARAVHHAHQRGILHRDLKPGNILLDREGAPFVADFGLARRVGREGTDGGADGTFGYMAPEQARGEPATVACDVFGLGAVLYELLTGTTPCPERTGKGVVAWWSDRQPQPPSQFRPDVSRHLERICMKCLAGTPEARYTSADALADDLHRWLDGVPVDEQPAVVDLVRDAFGRWTETPRLDTWPAIFCGTALFVVVHAIIFLLARTACPIWTVWLAFCLCLVGTGATIWHYHLRHYRSLMPVERQSVTIHVGTLLAAGALLLATGPVNPTASAAAALAWYPPLTIVHGLAIFIHGMTHWGRLYASGLGFFALGVALSFVPEWAPLLYGLAVGLHGIWIALKARQLVARVAGRRSIL